MTNDDFRSEFIRRAEQWWDALETDDGKATEANRISNEMSEWLNKFDGLVDKLCPLLEHDHPVVQCLAASALVHTPARETAVGVLENLREHKMAESPALSRAAMDADTVLMSIGL